MASLHEVQRSLRDWITAPEGVAARIEERDSALPHDQRGAARRELTDLVRGDAALDAIGRLEIYANAYFYRIASVLESDYSALAAGCTFRLSGTSKQWIYLALYFSTARTCPYCHQKDKHLKTSS